MIAAESAVSLEMSLIDIRVLSNVTGRSVPALERDEHAGRIPRPIRLGRSKRWRRTEIVAWIEAGCPVRDQWEAMQAAAGKKRTG